MRFIESPIRSWCTVLVMALALAFTAPVALQAQEAAEEEDPGMRVVTVTTFQVPFYDRDKVFPFMRKYVFPASQLNHHVVNYRVMWHNWGADASQVILVAEYEDFAHIEAECGRPCDDYFEANPEPEEGDEGRGRDAGPRGHARGGDVGDEYRYRA